MRYEVIPTREAMLVSLAFLGPNQHLQVSKMQLVFVLDPQMPAL